ncbi:MAG: radical SAM/SPASM domain-containing protein [Streptosporangiaceae bacterium]
MTAVEVPSAFDVIEIEINSRCNRRCGYCPVSLEPRPAVPAQMPDEVFRRIAADLAAMSFTGRISYHFYNEPLLRRDLERLVAELRHAAPGALQVLYTNGDRLTDERHRGLVRAGVDAFIVTAHDDQAVPDRPLQWVQTGSTLKLTNRAGRLVHLPTPTALISRTPCFAPTDMLIVTVTGDVVLCYEDSERSEVMGNVLELGLMTIWTSPRFVAMRQALQQGRRRDASALCARCTNVAHTFAGSAVVDEPFSATGQALTRQELRARSDVVRRAQP